MKLIYALLIVSLAGCAKNSLDIVNDGKPMGVFEPKKDYVVDIPMGSSKVSGESSGVEILGIFISSSTLAFFKFFNPLYFSIII